MIALDADIDFLHVGGDVLHLLPDSLDLGHHFLDAPLPGSGPEGLCALQGAVFGRWAALWTEGERAVVLDALLVQRRLSLDELWLEKPEIPCGPFHGDLGVEVAPKSS